MHTVNAICTVRNGTETVNSIARPCNANGTGTFSCRLLYMSLFHCPPALYCTDQLLRSILSHDMILVLRCLNTTDINSSLVNQPPVPPKQEKVWSIYNYEPCPLHCTVRTNCFAVYYHVTCYITSANNCSLDDANGEFSAAAVGAILYALLLYFLESVHISQQIFKSVLFESSQLVKFSSKARILS